MPCRAEQMMAGSGGPRACARTRAASLVAPTAADAAQTAARDARIVMRRSCPSAGPTPPVTCSHNVPLHAPQWGPHAAALMPFVYGMRSTDIAFCYL